MHYYDYPWPVAVSPSHACILVSFWPSYNSYRFSRASLPWRSWASVGERSSEALRPCHASAAASQPDGRALSPPSDAHAAFAISPFSFPAGLAGHLEPRVSCSRWQMSRDRKDCSVAFTTQESQTPPRGRWRGRASAQVILGLGLSLGLDVAPGGQAGRLEKSREEGMGEWRREIDTQRKGGVSSYMNSCSI